MGKKVRKLREPRRRRHLAAPGALSALLLSSRLRIDSWRETADALRRFRIHRYQISGIEKASGRPLSLSYLGTGNHLAYVKDWIFSECSSVASPGTELAWRARHWASAEEVRADLLIADLPSPYHRLLPSGRFLECPAWLNQRLPIADTWQEVKAGFRRSARSTTLRRIRQFDLQDRLTRDRAAVDDFYHQMYVPYLQGRFGEAAFLEPFERIRWFVDHGHLLQILRDEKVVAAAVLYGWARTLDFLWVGLRGGLNEDSASGAHGALYYYGILHGFENGYRELDLSGTRPLLNDGVYRFKRQWGASIQDGWCSDRLLLEPRNLTPAVAAFLERSPIIVRRPGGLVGKVFFITSPPTHDDLRQIQSLYPSDGIQVVKIVSLQPVEPSVTTAIDRTDVELVVPEPDRDKERLQVACRL